jgi:hypothetical protein
VKQGGQAVSCPRFYIAIDLSFPSVIRSFDLKAIEHWQFFFTKL